MIEKPKQHEVLGTATGLVYLIEDRVALEVGDLGRIEFPADAAESVGKALIKGANLVRAHRAKQHGKIILP